MDDRRRQSKCTCGTRLDSRGRCSACYQQQRHSHSSGSSSQHSSSAASSRTTSSPPSPRNSVDNLALPIRTRRPPAHRVLEESLAAEDGRSLFNSSALRSEHSSRRSSSSSSSTNGRNTPSPGSSFPNKRYSLIEEERSGPTSAPSSYSRRNDARERIGRGSLDAARPVIADDDDRTYSPLSAGFASLSMSSSRRSTLADTSRPGRRTSSGVELAAGMFGGAA